MIEPVIGAVLILAALFGFGVTWRWTRDDNGGRPWPPPRRVALDDIELDPSDSAGA